MNIQLSKLQELSVEVYKQSIILGNLCHNFNLYLSDNELRFVVSPSNKSLTGFNPSKHYTVLGIYEGGEDFETFFNRCFKNEIYQNCINNFEKYL